MVAKIIPALEPFAVPIDSLQPDPGNARLHDAGSIEAIRQSLERFGQDQLIVVQKEGAIIRKGNGRWEAARQLGWTHIAAVMVDEEDIEAVARAIADNRTAELSKWDPTALAKALEGLSVNERTAGIGFTAEQISGLVAVSTSFLDKAKEGAEHGAGQAQGDVQTETPAQLPAEAAEYVALTFSLTPAERDKVMDLLQAKRQELGLDGVTQTLLACLGVA